MDKKNGVWFSKEYLFHLYATQPEVFVNVRTDSEAFESFSLSNEIQRGVASISLNFMNKLNGYHLLHEISTWEVNGTMTIPTARWYNSCPTEKNFYVRKVYITAVNSDDDIFDEDIYVVTIMPTDSYSQPLNAKIPKAEIDDENILIEKLRDYLLDNIGLQFESM